ncbi:hypothetical protein F5Y09DRAFT_200992 [Xylaria sp. FL1042]|nr:hypothetical protein F5Y09DRAFT_200992 [Xylaria sp. FL1042]
MISLFSDPEWRNTHSDLLHTLTQASRPSGPDVAPNTLPSEADARLYFDHYLQGSHVQKPFLLRQNVEDLFAHLYTYPKSLLNQEMFRMYMILSLGSISTFRKHSHHNHPFGYYLAALKYFDPAVIRGQLSAIQDLLLIARFWYLLSYWYVSACHSCLRLPPRLPHE